MDHSEHHLVFVAGLHRSGTSLVARCLAAHPEVSGLSATGVAEDEGQHLQEVYRPASYYGGPGTFAFDPRARLTEVDAAAASVPARKRAQRLFAAWAPYWDLAKPVLVEKSPPNLLMLRFLQQLYPQASFVLVLRHPVVVSLATAKWCRMLSVEALVAHWLQAHELAAEDAALLRRVHVIRYEHLVRDPRPVLDGLVSFLDLSGPIPQRGVAGGRSRRYERAWRGYRSPVRPLRRRERLRVEERMAARCAAFGYELDDLVSAAETDVHFVPTDSVDYT